MNEYMKKMKSDDLRSSQQPAESLSANAGGLPNSAMLSVLGHSNENAGMSLALMDKFERAQNPAAEREADSIARGITGSTPEEVKSRLGEKMGADFSLVNFHTDNSAAERSVSMGAQAYTQGNEVYWGNGEFDPEVAAHELVHTVQQGVVSSDMSVQNVSEGNVQMKSDYGLRDRMRMAIHRKTGHGSLPDIYEGTPGERYLSKKELSRAASAAGRPSVSDEPKYGLMDRMKMAFHRKTGHGPLPDIMEGTSGDRYLSKKELNRVGTPIE